MDLAQIAFKVDTSELERASKVVNEMVRDVQKFDKASQASAKIQMQWDETLSRIAKNQAAASKDQAKARDIELKSTIAADKADQQREKTLSKTIKTTEGATASTSQLEKLIFKVTETTSGMTSGLSKGQAQLIATAKALGATNDQLDLLIQNEQTQRKLSGGNPFDKTNSGAIALRNSLTELNAANRLYGAGLDLTQKQSRDLARDQLRLIESAKANEQSIFSVRDALRQQQAEYVTLAAQFNKQQANEDKIIKARKQSAQAAEYLTTADQKLAAALNQSNAGIQKAGTDLLVKYENALKKSGVASADAAVKLAAYKTQLAQVQALEDKRQANNLTRAISPQLTDIGVSLYSGQAPLTVLLQQGGQLADLFRLSGVEAGKLGKLMKESFYGMIPVIKEVGSALGALVVGVFTDLGAGAVKAVADFTRMSAAVDLLKRAVVSGGEANFKYIKTIETMGKVLNGVAAGGFAALLVVLTAVAVATYRISDAQNEMTKNLLQNGAALGLNITQARAFADSLSSIGVNTITANNALGAFAKAGVKGNIDLAGAIKSAVDLQKTFGIAIDDTAKEFAKLQEEPYKALLDIAIATGNVSSETLALVKSLEDQGKTVEAVKVATDALKDSNNQMTAEYKASLSPLEKLWLDIKAGISATGQAINDLAQSAVVVGTLRTAWAALAIPVNIVYNLIKNVGTIIGGMGAAVAAFLSGNFKEAGNIVNQMTEDQKANAESQKRQIDNILGIADATKKLGAEDKKFNSDRAQALKDNQTYLKDELSRKEKLVAKEKELGDLVKKNLLSQVEATKILQGYEKSLGKEPKGDQSAIKQATKDLEVFNDLTKEAEGYTKSYNNELASLDRLLKSSTITQVQYADAVAKLNAMQPKAIAEAKQRQTLLDLENKLLGRANDLGSEYYKNLELINNAEKTDPQNADRYERMRKALEATTPLARANAELQERQRDNAQKLTDQLVEQNSELNLSGTMLNQQYSLLGLTSEQQRLATIEQTKQNKLTAVAITLEKQLADIKRKVAKGDLSDSDGQSLRLEVEKQYAEQVRQINKETALQYLEDYDKTLRGIKEGLTDSIVTAMFDGGKAGAQKLRDVITNVLRNKFTIWLDAQVSGGVNSLLGSSSSGGGLLGGLVNSVSNLFGGSGTSSLTGLISEGISSGLGGLLGIGGSSLVASNTALAASLGLGSGSAAAAASAASSAGLGALSGTIGAALPYVGIGIAAISALGKVFGKKGGPKVEGMYTTQLGLLGHTNRTSALDPVAEATYNSISEGYAKLVTQLGGTAGTVGGAIHVSTDPKGTAQTQLQTIATLNGVQTYNRGSEYGGIENVGRTEEELQAAISESITKSVLTLVQSTESLDPRIAAFVKGIEYKGKTIEEINAQLARATSFIAFNNLFKTTPFENLKTLSMEATESLVSLTGSLDTLANSVSSFYTNFYSEAERASMSQANLVNTFTKLNIAIPRSIVAFRDLVNAQDLTTDSGRQTYLTLLSVSEVFAELNKTLKQTAFDNLSAAIDKEQDSLNAAKTASEDLLKTIESVFDVLESNLRDLYGSLGTSAQNVAAANAWIDSTLAGARSTGALPTSTDLSNNIATARTGLTSDNFSNALEQKKATARLVNKLQELADITGTQKSFEEKQIEFYTKQIEDNQKLLDNSKLQLDASNGIIASNLTVAEALMQFQAALLGDSMGSSVVTPTVTTPVVVPDPVAEQVAKESVQLNFNKYLTNLLNAFGGTTNATLTDTRTPVVPNYEYSAYAEGGNYPGGLALVGEKGPELINFNRPGYVHTASQTAGILNSSSGSDNSRLERLENSMIAVLSNIADNTEKTKKILERVSSESGGDSISIVGTVTTA